MILVELDRQIMETLNREQAAQQTTRSDLIRRALRREYQIMEKQYISITWRISPDGSIGWCNLCQSPIYAKTDPCANGLHAPEHAGHNCEKRGCWAKAK